MTQAEEKTEVWTLLCGSSRKGPHLHISQSPSQAGSRNRWTKEEAAYL